MDDTRSARYHANLAADYAHEAAVAKQAAGEGHGDFSNRVGGLRVKSKTHADAAQALALCDIVDTIYTVMPPR